MLVLDLAPGELDWQRLSSCQRDAADGLYAQAMASFVQWLASRYEKLRSEQVAHARRLLESADWVDGRITAGHKASLVKDNAQLPEQHPVGREVRARHPPNIVGGHRQDSIRLVLLRAIHAEER